MIHRKSNWYQTLVDAAPAVVLCLDPNGRILEFNPEAERVYGHARRQVLGKNYFEFFLPSNVRDAVRADVAKVLCGQPTYDYENEVLSQSGVRTVIRWNVKRVLSYAGEPVAIVALGQDVTHLKDAELRAARGAHERLLRLTPREREVLELVVSGLLNKQVAAKLGTSEKTIKVHRARVMHKMEAGSVAELVALSLAAGLRIAAFPRSKTRV